MKHESSAHPKKNWKRVLSEDAIIEKYKLQGYDENVLNEIKNVIARWIE